MSLIANMTTKERINKTINAGVREVRRSLGLSMEGFAEGAGVSAGVILRIEKNQQVTRCGTVLSIMETYNVSADYLCFGTLPMFRSPEVSGVDIEAGLRTLFGKETCEDLGEYHLGLLGAMISNMKSSHHLRFAILDFLVRFFRSNGIEVSPPKV